MSLQESNIKDLIYLYIDGQTTDVESKILFDALATDSELQNEFDAAMKLDKAIASDKEVLIPSAELTSKLFEKAGIAPPEDKPIVTPLFSELMRNVLNNAAAGIVAASLLFSGYNLIKTMSNPTNADIKSKLNTEIIEKYRISNKNSSTQNNIQANFAKNGIPIAKSSKVVHSDKATDISNNNIQKQNNKQLIVRNKAANNSNDNQIAENIAPNNINELADNIDNNTNITEHNNLNALNNLYVLNNSADFANNINIDGYNVGMNANTYFPMNIPQASDSKISLRLNGVLNTNFFPNRDIFQSNNFSKNLNAAVNYHYSNKHSFGIEGGAEDFQMYEVRQEDNIFNFDLQPTLYWVGLNYRYTFNAISDIAQIRPYTQVTAGGSKFGPVTKLGIGITYEFMNNITIGLGYDWTSLMYTEMSTYKFTHKTGFNYSISYKL